MTVESSKGTFYVNNSIFDKDVSCNAKLVYIYLCKCADCFGKSWPSHNNISRACSLGLTSVKAALGELRAKGIVTVSHRYREGGGKSSNLYILMDRTKNKTFWCNPRIFMTRLSSKAKLVYLFFCRCSNKEGNCYPAHRTTAGACKVSISAVRIAIKELVEGKMLEVLARVRDNNGQTSNLYTILMPVINAVATVIKKRAASSKSIASKVKQRRSSGLIASIQSHISRGLRRHLTGGLSNTDYERTIPI